MPKTRAENEMDIGRTAFMGAFEGDPPTHLSRAPGRVNLIGEHTDYNDLPVFPMALQKEVRVFFRSRDDDRVQIENFHSEFEHRSFQLSADIPNDPAGDWGNYLKAPCQALVQRFGPLKGFDALVLSTVPVASGLSSSSALVNAVAGALLHANAITFPTVELAEAMAVAERYTGTQGGGMDQAISLGAREGHASRIEFNPLSLHESPVPPEWRFVVAHTLVRAEKSGGAQEAYNRRRVECTEALALMREIPLVKESVGEGHVSPPSYPDLITKIPVADLVEAAATALPPHILPRFRHVVTEAVRVYSAEEAMREEDLLTFGILMDASHESLRVDYEVSCPELDELVEIARNAGAAGARLTGAGFGGCMVALAEANRVDRVLEAMEAGYFESRSFSGPLSNVLFVAEAGAGASVQALS
jgi:galactokinase